MNISESIGKGTSAKAGDADPHRPSRIGGAEIYRAFMFCCFCYFSGSILHTILRYGVNVPFWDEWGMIDVFRQVSDGRMSWGEALLLRNAEHRIGMQLLISILGWQLTGMNVRAVMVLNWALATGFCLLAAMVTRKAMPPGSTIPWTALGAIGFFVFNPAAYKVWVLGLPLVYVVVPLMLVCGMAAAQSRLPESAKLVVMSSCALLGSFTRGSGLLLWVLSLPVLFCYTEAGLFRRCRVAAAVSATLLLAAVLAVSFGLMGSSPASSNTGPGTIPAFFLAYTGTLAALIADPPPLRGTQLVGLAFIVFFMAVTLLSPRRFYKQPEWRAWIIWTCLGL